jgi:hypothetical protein
MAKTKLLLVGILFGFTALFLHNAWYYSPYSGYDAGIHQIYTQIVTFEKRIPLPVDTPESYNPPTFYFLSGQLAKMFTPMFNDNFFEALKSWQILMAFLLVLAGWCWYDIFRILNPKRKQWGFFFLLWLLSLPVINKLAPMYNIETPQLILSSFISWYFIKYVLPRPTFKKMLLLGILGGIIFSFRIMSASLLLSLGLLLIILAWTRMIGWKQMIIYNLVFTLTTLIIGGQYYYLYRNQGVFDSGENVAELYQKPFFQRQPRSFYVDTFFRTMMRTPIRPNFPNRFIPIFYSSFWGDYWNYYRQRRFPLSAEEEIVFAESTNKVKISKERLSVLAWQNRINVIPTLVIIIGIFVGTVSLVKKIAKRRQLAFEDAGEVFVTLFLIIAFLMFFYTNIQFPNTYKGDTIKASYMLSGIPGLIYLAVKQLMRWINKRYLLYSLMGIIIISIGFNLRFDYF